MVAHNTPREGSSPRIMFYTAPVLVPSTPAPPKSEFYQNMQDFFGAKAAGKITPDTVCYRVFLCSWTGEPSPASYKGESEPRCSMTRFAETPATAYLTQWVMVGSTPHLVMYNQGYNTHMIQGEIAETQELQVLSGQTGQIKVAGGGYIPTNFGSYKARLGPSRSGS